MAEEESGERPPEQTFIPGQGLTPIFSNRYSLWANDHTVHFVMGDSITGPDTTYSQMFVMTRGDALDLVKTLSELLADTDPQAKAK
jgi:hypothetical protein